MRPSPSLGTTGEAEYSPEGAGDECGGRDCEACAFRVPGEPKRFTLHNFNTSLSVGRPPTRPSAAGAGPPAVLDSWRTTELAAGEPGPHATRWPQINRRLGAGSQIRHVRPGQPPPPSTHGRQGDGGGGPTHQRHGPRKERPGPGTGPGGFPPSRRTARTRPVPTAVRSGLPRRERRERRGRRPTAQASCTSRRAAASARSSRP
jgi:hypothetical protein